MGLTDDPGQGSGILTQFANRPAGSDPASPKWEAIIYVVDVGVIDEYMRSFVPESVGDYDCQVRFSTNLGFDWTYTYTD